jgi:hypothetical protein
MNESFFQLPVLTSHYPDPGQHWETSPRQAATSLRLTCPRREK